jgi:SAM-dependent methyltransferase
VKVSPSEREQSTRPECVIWQDVECGSYAADLGLWRELAEAEGGPVLDLGCGTGRVAIDLARRGHAVTGVEVDEALAASLRERAGGLPIEVEVGDVRDLDSGRGDFRLAIAPMQLLQLLGGSPERVSCLRGAARRLQPGGLAAVAIVERLPDAEGEADAEVPDVHEVDGWVYSSLPLDSRLRDGRLLVRRLRQSVSPGGELQEDVDMVVLDAVDAEQLEAEGERAGLSPVGRLDVAPTEAHVGSTVVLMRKEAG